MILPLLAVRNTAAPPVVLAVLVMKAPVLKTMLPEVVSTLKPVEAFPPALDDPAKLTGLADTTITSPPEFAVRESAEETVGFCTETLMLPPALSTKLAALVIAVLPNPTEAEAMKPLVFIFSVELTEEAPKL